MLASEEVTAWDDASNAILYSYGFSGVVWCFNQTFGNDGGPIHQGFVFMTQIYQFMPFLTLFFWGRAANSFASEAQYAVEFAASTTDGVNYTRVFDKREILNSAPTFWDFELHTGRIYSFLGVTLFTAFFSMFSASAIEAQFDELAAQLAAETPDETPDETPAE